MTADLFALGQSHLKEYHSGTSTNKCLLNKQIFFYNMNSVVFSCMIQGILALWKKRIVIIFHDACFILILIINIEVIVVNNELKIFQSLASVNP